MELTTKTGSNVATEVKRLFGDEDAVQISDADILRWINAAQRKIVSVNPILQRTLVHDTVAGQADYYFPADRIQYIQSISFKTIPLEGLSYAEAQEYILRHNGAGKTSSTPLIWYQWAQQITLWPAPEADESNVLKLDFVAIPEDLTVITDTLALPDRYFDAVVEFVLQRAHLLDENYDAANMSRGQFGESLSQLSEQENRTRLSTYPMMTVREEDM